MQAQDYVIRVRRLDGQWEHLGVGQDADVDPESLDLSANARGPDQGSFTLKRRPEQPRLDLAHDSPVEVEVGGLLVWDGRIVEAPAGEAINVACEGWQYAEDDFTYTAPYVHHDLSDWRDGRAVLTAQLGTGFLTAYFQVNQEDGALTILIPKGTNTTAGDYGVVILDAGPDAYWLRAGIEYECNGANLGGDPRLYIRGHTRPDNNTWTADDIVSGETFASLGAKGMRAGQLPSGSVVPFVAKRYLQLFVYMNATGGPTTGDQWLKVKAARASGFTSTGQHSGPPNFVPDRPTNDAAAEPMGGYVMGAKSRLRPDHVIVDAFNRVSQLTSPGTYESASFRDEVLGTEALYAYYRFQELAGATVAADSSGNKRTATITGAVTLAQARLLAADLADPDPVSGAQSIQFTANTAAQHVDVPTLDITESGLTVEAVFKTPLGGTDELTLFSIGDAYAAGHYLHLYVSTVDSKLYWGNQHTAGQFTLSTNALVAGRTYYVLAAYHPSYPVVMFLYDATTGVFQNVTATTQFAWLGGATPTAQVGNFTIRNATSGLIGTIDELALFQQFMFHPETGALTSTWRTIEGRRRGLAALKREVGAIKRSGFSIGNYNHQARSPREAIDAANAFNGYQPQVLPGRTWRLRAQPSTPVAKIGVWEGAQFANASNMSGRDVINSARCVGQDPAGNPIVSVYSTADLPDAILSTAPAPQPVNPSFDVNANNWAVDGGGGGVGIPSRDTGTFDTSPASLLITNPTPGPYTQGVYTQSFTGQFQAGRAYFLRLRIAGAAGLGGASATTIRVLDGQTGQTILSQAGPTISPGGVFSTFLSNRWLPRGNTIIVLVQVTNTAGAGALFYLDTIQVLASAYTVLDRQGGFREKVMTATQPVTQQIADQLAKLLLLSNMTTPFKGQAVVDNDGMRSYRDDRSIASVEALLMAGELLHVAHVNDPDKGALGRDGRIVNVSWNYKSQAARLDLDNQRGEFENLLARYGVRVS